MKKAIRILIFVVVFFTCISILAWGFNISNNKVMIRNMNDKNLPNYVQAILCYSTGASGLSDSNTFLLSNNKLEESADHYYLAYSHIFSDEEITKKFAKPLGYKDGKEMVRQLGQIFDYKNFDGVEVLILNNWYEENGELSIIYNIAGDLKIAECNVGDATLLGTYLDENMIYVFLTFENEVMVVKTNINDNFCTKISIPYAGMIRNRTDLLESNILIRNGIIYLGEYTVDYEKDEMYSTITSFSMDYGIIKCLRFEDGLLYHLSSTKNELVALFATDKNEAGYYQQIDCKMIDFDLSLFSNHKIQNLPNNIETMKLRDSSRVHENVLYTIIDSIYPDKNYLIAYELQKREIIYCGVLENKIPNKVLFDWSFYIQQ